MPPFRIVVYIIIKCIVFKFNTSHSDLFNNEVMRYTRKLLYSRVTSLVFFFLFIFILFIYFSFFFTWFEIARTFILTYYTRVGCCGYWVLYRSSTQCVACVVAVKINILAAGVINWITYYRSTTTYKILQKSIYIHMYIKHTPHCVFVKKRHEEVI